MVALLSSTATAADPPQVVFVCHAFEALRGTVLAIAERVRDDRTFRPFVVLADDPDGEMEGLCRERGVACGAETALLDATAGLAPRSASLCSDTIAARLPSQAQRIRHNTLRQDHFLLNRT